MPTLEQISEAAATASERIVQESMALDYAYQAGKLTEFVDRKYQQLTTELYGDSGSNAGQSSGTNPAT